MSFWSKIPNSITGILVVAAGIGVSYLPVAGPIAGPILITAGLAQLGIGAVSKVARVNRGEDPFSKERAIVKSFNKKED